MTLIGLTPENIKKAHITGEKVLLTKEEKDAIYKGYDKLVKQSTEEIGNLKFLIYGTILGLVGGFLSQGIYDGIKSTGTDILILYISISLLIFTILVIFLLIKINEQKNNLKLSLEQQQKFDRAKNLRF